MKSVIDLHTHTISSGHAYSTLKENIDEGRKKGLLVLGTSDHSHLMPGAAHPIFFDNYKVIPREIDGIRILTGIEANIYNFDGKIDVEMSLLKKVDYIIASLHTPCIISGTIDENTNALIGAMKNPFVKIIGHPDDGRYPIDYDRIAYAAKENEVALELNNSSLCSCSTRQNGRKNAKKLLKKCMEYDVMVIIGSDSHICYDVGKFTEAYELLEEVGFPEELIINTNIERISYILNN